MQNPLISIIIPTYNRAYIISETLDSIIAQTYAYWECIVVDDGSDDNTSEVMKAYCECDNRIQYHKRPENIIKGASSCRNYGIKRSEGEYIQFLDSDDVLNKVKLEEQINVITKADKFSIATCKWGRFSNVQNLFSNFKNEYISYKDFDNGSDLLKSFAINREFFPVSVYLISRVLLDKSGHWNEKLSNNDDGELFVRILLETNKIFFVQKK
ncbi:hypothetical protein A9996_07590 [Gelidibacter algens]|uniref:glycosyltransferase family 2 protein n=1 Tax=Gelidibacter algens TaxID=49280 RepID=UPI0008048968|nr:glycosyltransferase family A protein [Gelidibacter algens]OBX21232.1 hypothetical protein A9996_18370 [Gelidibacter algens]OBX25970.1 hypothetical protein A9996_07590 [Gelidibacter algens]